jgi:hypothetical protein
MAIAIMGKGEKMSRLIDAEIKVKVQLLDGEHEEFITKEMTVEEVLDAYTEEGCPPTVDAEPVRHGRWIYLYDGNYKCSECGSWWTCEETPIESGMLFCPNCGAKMDEVEE